MGITEGCVEGFPDGRDVGENLVDGKVVVGKDVIGKEVEGSDEKGREVEGIVEDGELEVGVELNCDGDDVGWSVAVGEGSVVG